MTFAEVHGSRLFYEETGQGPPLVLLHGLGGNAREWDLQVPAFSARYRVIVPELRGHGRSDLPTTPKYTPFDHARDVVGLLDTLGIPKAWVLGISAGGFVTLALALEHPDRLHGVILVATAPHSDKFTIAVATGWAEAFKSGGIEAYLDRLMKDIFYPDYLLDHLDELDGFRESQKGRDFRGIAPSATANVEFDVRGRIGKIRLPALVIHGLDDRVVDATHARILRQSILGSEMRLYPHTGHMLIIERPKEFNEVVLDFLDREGRPPAEEALP